MNTLSNEFIAYQTGPKGTNLIFHMVSIKIIKPWEQFLAYDYKVVSLESMEFVPIKLSIEHIQLLSHHYLLINEGNFAIPKNFEKLIESLRTARANEYPLDKAETSYDNLLKLSDIISLF